jgi:cobalamin biosynthesis Co2+ chelatase CbiK
MMNVIIYNRFSITCDEDVQVQNLLEGCDFEEVINIYQRLKPDFGRILNAIGVLYVEKRGDYHTAINYHNMALQIQEKVDRLILIVRRSEKNFFLSIE